MVRPSVRPSIRPSVRPSVRHKLGGFQSSVCLDITQDTLWGDSVCLGEKKIRPPPGPLGPHFSLFLGYFGPYFGFRYRSDFDGVSFGLCVFEKF